MRPAIIHRKTKLEIMKAVIALERRGFECIKPIHTITNVTYGKVDYHAYTSTYWRAIMKKVN